MDHGYSSSNDKDRKKKKKKNRPQFVVILEQDLEVCVCVCVHVHVHVCKRKREAEAEKQRERDWVSTLWGPCRLCYMLRYMLFRHQIVSDSLWPHGLQHIRLLCPSPSPGVCSNSCPLNQWYYLTISSSVAPFSFSLESFPASGSFPMSRLFISGGQIYARHL